MNERDWVRVNALTFRHLPTGALVSLDGGLWRVTTFDPELRTRIGTRGQLTRFCAAGFVERAYEKRERRAA